ncbi:MAG: T9SS type A sorting domain-containing protein [Ferruginibacter sp.]
MKIIFTLAIFSVLSLSARPVFSTSLIDHCMPVKKGIADNKKLSISSNRKSGEIQLLFTTVKIGEAAVTVLDETGKIVLQQTSQVTNSINTIPLKNATGLAEGAYSVRLISNNEIYTTSLLIWK